MSSPGDISPFAAMAVFAVAALSTIGLLALFQAARSLQRQVKRIEESMAVAPPDVRHGASVRLSYDAALRDLVKRNESECPRARALRRRIELLGPAVVRSKSARALR